MIKVSRNILDSIFEHELTDLLTSVKNQHKPQAEEFVDEEFEVVKGNFKTNITVRFNKKGYAISTSWVSN